MLKPPFSYFRGLNARRDRDSNHERTGIGSSRWSWWPGGSSVALLKPMTWEACGFCV